MIRTEFTPDSQGSFKDRQKEGPGGLALTTLETVPPGKGFTVTNQTRDLACYARRNECQ